MQKANSAAPRERRFKTVLEEQRYDFSESLKGIALSPTGVLPADSVSIVQVNLGKRCNQACLHCHVEAGPDRTEEMSAEVADRILALLQRSSCVTTLDITGGAPELCPEFRKLVLGARALGHNVIDRCNLTILFEPGFEDLAQFLADNQVQVVASLPCYSSANVDKQRGKGTFSKSIEALQLLNSLGYGQDPNLELNLVYNPVGAHLPPAQAKLEADYKVRLHEDFGIVFNHLFTITNMPISRYLHALLRDGLYDDYMSTLVQAFNPSTVAGLMCRHQISIGYTGKLYDCDFNQMLELGTEPEAAGHIDELESFDALNGREIATAPHCFGCTAGAGSSCGGALE